MTQLSPYWIDLAHGIAFDIERSTVEMINPGAIMHHLVMLSRWGGNVAFPYNVLQHSILVAEAMKDPAERIYGFIHDWPEALLGGDVCSPYKLYYATKGVDVNGIERRFMNLIYQHLHLPAPSRETAERVHEADQRVLATEFRDVVHGRSGLWTPKAPPLSRTIKFQNWANTLEQGHTLLDAYLWAHQEAA